MPVVNPGFAHVAHVHSLTGDPEEMVSTYGVAVDVGTDPNGLATALHSIWVTNVVDNLLGNTYQLLRTEVLVGADPEPLQGVFAFTEVGPNATARAPQNCALLVQKRSALGGRANRGRMFVPGVLPEGNVNDQGMITAGTLASMQAAFDGLLSDISGAMTGAVDGMVVLHESALDPTPVTSLVVQPLIATQRRRLRP